MSEATDQLLEGLKAHYRGPSDDVASEILLTEIEAPGHSGRRCDLLRMPMWKSRGTGIDVHELKVSRSDWLRELNDKGKAEAWWPHCNRFWVVAPRDIVDPAELPPGWGLLVPPKQDRHRRFKPIVKAENRPIEPSVGLMTRIVKRLATEAQKQAAIEARAQWQRDRERLETELREAKKDATLDYRDRQALEVGQLLIEQLGGEDSARAWSVRHDIEAVLEHGGDIRRLTNAAKSIRGELRRTRANLDRALEDPA